MLDGFGDVMLVPAKTLDTEPCRDSANLNRLRSQAVEQVAVEAERVQAGAFDKLHAFRKLARINKRPRGLWRNKPKPDHCCVHTGVAVACACSAAQPRLAAMICLQAAKMRPAKWCSSLRSAPS